MGYFSNLDIELQERKEEEMSEGPEERYVNTEIWKAPDTGLEYVELRLGDFEPIKELMTVEEAEALAYDLLNLTQDIRRRSK